MKKKYASPLFIKLSVGILLILLAVGTKVKAQCPGPNQVHPFSYEYGYSTWTPTSAFITFQGCPYTVYYCRRVVQFQTLDTLTGLPNGFQNYYQTYNYAIDMDSTCYTGDPQLLIDALADELLTVNLPPSFYPPCNEQFAKMHGVAYRPCCWLKPDSTGHLFVGCTGESENLPLCEMICNICMDGAAYKVGCSFQQLGIPTCDAPPPGPWSANTCYFIQCGINPH
ncbi:MAG: hypothetical protein ABI778_01955 [Ignavibacteriota bacterium]